MLMRFLKAWLPVAGMCVAIFLFSQDRHSGQHSHEVLGWILSLLGVNTPHLHRVLDEPFRKLAHVVVYSSLGSLAYRGFALGRKLWDFPAAVRSLIFTAAYACTDEYHQTLIPGRGPSIHDVLLDTAAAALAMVVIWSWKRPRRGKPSQTPLSESGIPYIKR